MKKRIAIHSVPRSGSTWLGSIFDSHPEVAYRYQPLFSYGHKSALSPLSTQKEITEFFEDILQTQDEFVLQKEAIERGLIPQFHKEKVSHIVYKEVRYHHILENMLAQDDELKVIGLVRNPFAVIHSWLNAPKEFRKDLGWKEQEEWRFAPKKNLQKPEEFNGFEKWKEVAQLFLRLKEKYPNRFYLLEYNELLVNTESAIKRLFDFVGLSFSEQTNNFINISKSKSNSNAYSVFKQKKADNGWQGKLPISMVVEITKEIEKYNLEKFI